MGLSPEKESFASPNGPWGQGFPAFRRNIHPHQIYAALQYGVANLFVGVHKPFIIA
jgi:hypothetical protein